MMRQLSRFVFAAVAAVGVVAAHPAVARAHPIHTTLTVVSLDRNGASFSIRAFADDFSAVVARFAGKAVPKDSSVTIADVDKYLAARVTIAGADGKPIVVRSCGVRRERDLYWLCIRADAPNGGRGMTMRDQLLTELHPDQVNIVQVESATGKKTLLFTKDSAPRAIVD
jgi:hypothetical protein